jgi:hypothetical protein
MACVAGIVVAYFAGVVLAYLHMAATAPATAMSFADLWRFVALLFTLVFAWLLAICFLSRLLRLPLRR